MTLEAAILTHKMFPGSKFTREKYLNRSKEWYRLDRDGNVEVAYAASRFSPGERIHEYFFGSDESKHAEDWVVFTAQGERI